MIYLDNNATTFIDPLVFEEIRRLLSEPFGNASSIHHLGQRARGKLIEAYQKWGEHFSVKSDELIFTSGATEALNMLIRGAQGHIITSSLEHAAVLEPLKRTSCQVTYLDPLNGEGSIRFHQIEEAYTPQTKMLILTAANNETGILTKDLKKIGLFCLQKGIAFVVDGVALLGKESFQIPAGVSAICFSGHKIHAPAGIGLAVIRKSLKAQPLLFGGPQQHKMRGGTENLSGIIAFTKALQLLHENDYEKMRQLRDYFEKGLLETVPDILIHGKEASRVSNTSNIAFLGVDGETLVMRLDLKGVYASHGSACSTGALEPSRVLLSMRLSRPIARSSIRFSLSRFSTREEIEKALEIIQKTVSELRSI